MITLKDFLDRGYAASPYYYGVIRSVVKGDKDYERLSEMLKDKTIKDVVHEFRKLGYEYEGVDEFGEINATFNDEEAQLLKLSKGSNGIFVTVRESDGKVYQCEDPCSTPDGSLFSRVHHVGNDNITFDELIAKMKDARAKARREVLNYYNKKLRSIKRSYRDELERANARIKDL